MKSSSTLQFQTPKSSSSSSRGKSKSLSKSSIATTPSSSESNSGEGRPKKPNIIVRRLGSEFEVSPEEDLSPFPSDLPDPELAIEKHAPEGPIYSEVLDSPVMEEEEKEEVSSVADRRLEMGKLMDASTESRKKKQQLLDLCSDPLFLAKFQIGLTLLLISVVAALHFVVVALHDSVGDSYSEGSFFDLPPT